jgi:hypothetical protein
MIRAVDPPFGYAISIDQVVTQLKDWGFSGQLPVCRQTGSYRSVRRISITLDR